MTARLSLPILVALLAVPGCWERAPSIPSSDPPIEPSTTEGWEERQRDYAQKFAIVIGINDYPGASGLPKLDCARHDAVDVADLLTAEFGYAEEHVVRILDQEATATAVRKALGERLKSFELATNDSLLVFFAGHGELSSDDRSGYLCTAETQKSALGQTALSVSELRSILEKIPCRHKALILDCCYSGSLFRREDAAGGRDPEATDGTPVAGARGSASVTAVANVVDYYLAHPAFLGLSAGRLGAVGDRGPGGRNSIFTEALLKTMRERADTSLAGHCFTLRQLASRVESDVVARSGGAQIPNWGRLGEGDGDFVFRPTTMTATPSERLATREDEAKQIAYARALRQAEEELSRGNVGRATELLQGAEPLLGPKERGPEWRILEAQRQYTRPASVPPSLRVLAHQARPEWFLQTYAGTIDCWTSGGERRWSIPSPRDPLLSVSPDGSIVTVEDERGVITCVDGSSGASAAPFGEARHDSGQPSPVAHTGQVKGVDWNADGSQLASVGADGRLLVWKVADRSLIREIKPTSTVADIEDVSWSPDGRSLALAMRSEVQIVDAASGRTLQQLTWEGTNPTITKVAWSHCGRFVAANNLSNILQSVAIWRVGSWTRVPLSRGSQIAASSTELVWSPKEPLLAVATPQGAWIAGGLSAEAPTVPFDVIVGGVWPPAIIALSVPPAEVPAFRALGGRVPFVDWDRDGQLLVTTDEGAVRSMAPMCRVHQDVGSLRTTMELRPDGTALAVADERGVVLWDLKGWDPTTGDVGRLPKSQRINLPGVTALAWNPAGNQLAIMQTTSTSQRPLPFPIQDGARGYSVAPPSHAPGTRHDHVVSVRNGNGGAVQEWVKWTTTEVTGQDASFSGLAWKPSGKEILAQVGRTISVVNAEHQIKTLWTGEASTRPVMGPGGQWVCAGLVGLEFGTPGNLAAVGGLPTLHALANGRPDLDLDEASGTLLAARFSSDGEWLGIWKEDGGMLLIKTTTGEIHRRWRHRGLAQSDLSVLNDGRRLLAVAALNSSLWGPIPGEALLSKLPMGHRCAWSDDGRRMVIWSGAEGRILLY